MTGTGKRAARAGGSRWRIAGWSLAALLLLLPAVTNAPWNAFDYVVAAILIGGLGLAVELAVRMSANLAYRAAAGAALAAAFLTIWTNAAVGMIGDEHNVLNLMFAGVLALALVGAMVARARASGMAIAMTAAAAAQLTASSIGALTDPRGGILSAMFAGLWLLSAALFRKAAHDQGRSGAAAAG